jgi:hypothetical protein
MKEVILRLVYRWAWRGLPAGVGYTAQWRQALKRLMAFEKAVQTSLPKNRSTQAPKQEIHNRRRPPRQLIDSPLPLP